MTTLQWNEPSRSQTAVSSVATPWFAISMGLIGLIIGFALHRFIIPTTLSAEVIAPPPVQAVVIQPSPTKPLPSVGGGCGCGGGGGACGAALAPTPVPNS